MLFGWRFEARLFIVLNQFLWDENVMTIYSIEKLT